VPEKESYIFNKILLVTVAIFLGLALYAYNMFKEEKENIKNKNVVITNNTPIYHPPLTQRDKQVKSDNLPSILKNESNISKEDNRTVTVPEGAEYISVEEQELRAEIESNFSDELFSSNGQIIPKDELNNYPIAQTIPMDIFPSLGIPIEPMQVEENTTYQENFIGIPIEETQMTPF